MAVTQEERSWIEQRLGNRTPTTENLYLHHLHMSNDSAFMYLFEGENGPLILNDNGFSIWTDSDVTYVVTEGLHDYQIVVNDPDNEIHQGIGDEG